MSAERSIEAVTAAPAGEGLGFRALILGLGGLVAALFVGSLLVGPAALSPVESLSALVTGRGEAAVLVMREIRLPRAILAVLVGASLGLSGAALQGYLRNPLAEPGLIGVSASAALGAVIALQTGLAAAHALALPGLALAGALVAVLLLLGLAGPRGGAFTLILAGIAISALAGALTSLVLNLSPNPYAAADIVFWMMGSLADRSFTHVWLALPLTLVGWALLAGLGRGLDALTLGEDAAEAMGIRLSRLRLALVIGVAACVGAGVAVAGAIGFVGLIVPHLLRPLVGARPGRLLLASALGGAALLLASDLAVRLILPERDLKLGVLTAILGAPLFFHLIYKTRREGRA
ncbi:MAG: FecCD family ABC transporter permease [Rhodovulum sp.]